jgi:antibiotic biosynthesis monooxygenase (ABM) superfamily enzyme
LRQGSPDAPQRLMRWRIALLVLGVVVIVVMLAPLAP